MIFFPQQSTDSLEVTLMSLNMLHSGHEKSWKTGFMN